MENAKGSLAKEMMWNSIGNLVYCICQWVITILTVRLCSYEMAGYLSLAMSTSSTFSTISLFSMRNYQVYNRDCWCVDSDFHCNCNKKAKIIDVHNVAWICC